jgi:hypothetical protein
VSKPFVAADVVAELLAADFPIHVLSLFDFYNLARVLDTPTDLIGYLEIRADVLIPTLQPRVHEEKPVFEYFLEHLENLTEFRAKLRGEFVAAKDIKPYADALRAIYAGTADLTESYFIDRIVDVAHEIDESILSPLGDGTPGAGKSEYAIIAEDLGSIVRPRRAYLGREFLDAIKRAGDTNDIAFAHASSQKRDQCLLFLASPLPQTDRAQRNRDLRDHLILLKATRQVRRALGIATEAGFDSGRSFDMIVLEEDPAHVVSLPSYEQIREVGETLFGVATGT